MAGAIQPILKKTITIEIGVLTGIIDVVNDDELTYMELLGALEYAKMMLVKDWMED